MSQKEVGRGELLESEESFRRLKESVGSGKIPEPEEVFQRLQEFEDREAKPFIEWLHTIVRRDCGCQIKNSGEVVSRCSKHNYLYGY